MMWGYNYQNMMGGGQTFGVLSLLTWFVVLIDLIFLAVWLWKQIGKK